MGNNLDTFGELLMTQVRDTTIRRFEKILSGQLNSEHALKLTEKLSSFSVDEKNIIKELVIASVDSTIHNFLWTVEENDELLVLYGTEETGIDNLKEVSDGLCGEVYSEEGWIKKYSHYKENY